MGMDLSKFTVNLHSSICFAGTQVVRFDPFRLPAPTHDADVIFITHEHYDHFSPEDIRRAMKPDTVLVLPESCLGAAERAGFAPEQLFAVQAGGAYEVKGIPFTVLAAYNIGKSFHPKAKGWVGYVAELDGCRTYVAGDTDNTAEAQAVRCDAAFLPVGGKYTMTASEAAALAQTIRPQVAVPTHYGSIAGAKGDGDAFAAALQGAVPCVKML